MEIVEFLIRKGSKVEIKDSSGLIPLDLAIAGNVGANTFKRGAVVAFLLGKELGDVNIDVNLQERIKRFHKVDKYPFANLISSSCPFFSVFLM